VEFVQRRLFDGQKLEARDAHVEATGDELPNAE
jgi:hypothetical protein